MEAASAKRTEFEPADRFEAIERELLRDRFADFERAVLQDNIVLCDAKCGILLAFTGAMVIFCLDAVSEPLRHAREGLLLDAAVAAAFLGAAAAFLVSAGISLFTVMPRLRPDIGEDHIFWESAIFRLPVKDYLEQMRRVRIETERDEKLRHLHTLAAVCRSKYFNLRHAMRFVAGAFVLLVAAELGKVLLS
jgi:hypothetical protein